VSWKVRFTVVGWLCFLKAALIGVVPVTAVSMKLLVSLEGTKPSYPRDIL